MPYTYGYVKKLAPFLSIQRFYISKHKKKKKKSAPFTASRMR